MIKKKTLGHWGAATGICILFAGCASLPDREPLEGAEEAVQPMLPSPPSEAEAEHLRSEVARAISEHSVAELGVDDDLWARVRRGMGMPDARDEDRVLRYIEWHQEYSQYLEQVTARAAPFLHYILEEIEARGLPTELLLLPIVESAYLPMAQSPSQAAGIWQFIPSTGRHFGLESNWWYDGRRDIHASTQAALDYLTQLNERFEGDWPLALAAYNAGQGTVSRAIQRNERRGKPTDYWHLDLPRETQHYVPRLLALQAIVRDPQRYQVGLTPVPDEPRIQVVDTKGQIELAVAARLAGVDKETLRTLNPGFNRWATAPNGPHHLLLPADRVSDFHDGLSQLDDGERVTWQRHRIRSGENLGRIAARYDVTVGTLKEVNNLKGTIIRAGDHLLIPSPGVSRQVAAGPTQGNEPTRQVEYTVKPGDTLWHVARHHGVTVRDLARWNELSTSDILRPGQTLIIRTSGEAVSA
ncbi:lytic murein transglycosylase [Ectothiorhodospira haloalkaliphila]|uniref:Lytic murein transglycosylase n=1 Tax=Ectothiorhodospira haloalkaliphila TaxID=421628 RepID=W8KSJ1_9GAMM